MAKEMSKTTMVIGFFFAALLLGFASKMSFSREGFMQQDVGMPLDAPAMGPYDTTMGGWMASEHMPVGGIPQNTPQEGNKLMFLVGNEVDQSCCPSGFNTDSGCVCLTDENRDLMAHRGGNK